MPIFTNLKHAKYFLVALGVAFIVFDVSYYFMSVLPGHRNEMCIMGANLTPFNIVFSLFLSLMVGVMIAGFIALFAQNYSKNKMALTSLSGVGLVIGMLTTFCPVCTISVIPLFGLSIGLDVFSDQDIFIKVLSFGLMVISLYLLNKQLNNKCAFCVDDISIRGREQI